MPDLEYLARDEKTPPLGRFFFGDVLLGVALVLFSLSWVMPLHFKPWVSWHSEAFSFLAIVLLGWAGLARVCRSAGTRTVALPFAALPLIGLAGIAAVQRATGLLSFWGDVWAFWFYMATGIICLMFGFAVASARPRSATDASAPFILLAFALLLVALASSVIAFAQVFSLWEHSQWVVRMAELRRPGGNLAQPNQLATLLAMGVASLTFLHESKKIGGVASGLLLFLLCAGVAATESRAGALSMLALLGWWLLKRRVIGNPNARWVGIGWGIAFVAMFGAWPNLLNAMNLLSYQAVSRLGEGSLRFEMWSQMLQAVAMRPWTGWGIHQVVAAHNAVVDGYALSEPFTYSHNLVLDLAIWVGVPLALLLVSVSVVWLWRRTRDANQLLPWYGLAVALPLGIHSMLEYPFAYAYFLAPVLFLLGAVEGLLGGKPLTRIDVKPLAALLLVTTMVLSWSAIEYLKIEEDFRVARFEALRIGQTPDSYQKPQVILLTQLGVLLDGARISPRPGMAAGELALAKNVALRYPWTAPQNLYALSLALNGNPAEAVRQLRIMRAMQGEKVYQSIKINWESMAQNQYPQLRGLSLP